MALPSLLVTIEVRIAGAADFCEIASQGLGGDVFHRSLFVTPNVLWHYRADSISCQLRFRRTTSTITIRNSASSCHWFARTTTGWHRDNAGMHRRPASSARDVAQMAASDTTRMTMICEKLVPSTW